LFINSSFLLNQFLNVSAVRLSDDFRLLFTYFIRCMWWLTAELI